MNFQYMPARVDAAEGYVAMLFHEDNMTAEEKKKLVDALTCTKDEVQFFEDGSKEEGTYVFAWRLISGVYCLFIVRDIEDLPIKLLTKTARVGVQ